MRLFTAIELSDEVRAKIEALQAKLKPAAQIQWSPSANLHITTKFIGGWPAERLEELVAAIGSIPTPGPIHIRVRNVGWFSKGDMPHTFWAGIEAPPALYDLARATDAATHALGIKAETRPYTPHLTLARVRHREPLDELKQAVDSLGPLEFGSFTTSRYHLYLSEPSRDGTIYSKLAEFPIIP
jgi:2'-5' RNA ligase